MPYNIMLFVDCSSLACIENKEQKLHLTLEWLLEYQLVQRRNKIKMKLKILFFMSSQQNILCSGTTQISRYYISTVKKLVKNNVNQLHCQFLKNLQQIIKICSFWGKKWKSCYWHCWRWSQSTITTIYFVFVRHGFWYTNLQNNYQANRRTQLLKNSID